MSIFYLGNSEPKIVLPEEILPGMYEDRYFLPGVIHGGEEYLIRVYLNDAHSDEGDDHLQFEVDYITRSIIMEAKEEDPSLGDDFYQHLFNAENFCCPNDGKSNFSDLVEEWPKAMYMTHSELVAWADNPYTYEEAKKPYEVTYEEVLSHDFTVYAKNPDHAVDEFYRLSDESFWGSVTESHVSKVMDSNFNDLKKYHDSFSDDPSKIVVPLGDGFSLVAEKNADPNYKEIFVYLYNEKEGLVHQDLAIVSENYRYKSDEEGTEPIHGSYSVKIYSNPEDENWQQDFNFGRHEEMI